MCPFMCPDRGGVDRSQAVEASHRSPKAGRRQVGVAEGHRQGGVPEQLLQLGQGHSPHHGIGPKRVPEVVEREVLDARPPERQLERGTNPVPAGGRRPS
jgi:hypothetical protein